MRTMALRLVIWSRQFQKAPMCEMNAGQGSKRRIANALHKLRLAPPLSRFGERG